MKTTLSILLASQSLVSLASGSPVLSTRQSPPTPLYLFSFGDSYTTTHFDINGEQPSSANPLGNPSPPGESTVAGGLNYVGYLATKYNTTQVLAYDFGASGSTISSSIIPSDNAEAVPFEDQVGQLFEPKYTGSDKFWTSDNAIFTIFFGINDIGLPLTTEGTYLEDRDTRVPQLLDAYFQLGEELYNQGARRFMFVGVPPLDRSTYIQGYGSDTVSLFAGFVQTYNGQLAQRIPDFTSSHDGAVAVTYDYNRWMTEVLDNYGQYGFPDNTCNNGDGVSCIWYNNYHVGTKFNDLLAQRMLPAMNSLGFDGSSPVGGYFY